MDKILQIIEDQSKAISSHNDTITSIQRFQLSVCETLTALLKRIEVLEEVVREIDLPIVGKPH